jgi:hypothetical protein
MPSDHDDSSGTGRFSSPGSTTHEIRGGAAGQPAADAHPDGASGCRWLVNYMAELMLTFS